MRQRTDPTPSIPKSTETSCVQATRNSWSREEPRMHLVKSIHVLASSLETITNNRCCHTRESHCPTPLSKRKSSADSMYPRALLVAETITSVHWSPWDLFTVRPCCSDVGKASERALLECPRSQNLEVVIEAAKASIDKILNNLNLNGVRSEEPLVVNDEVNSGKRIVLVSNDHNFPTLLLDWF